MLKWLNFLFLLVLLDTVRCARSFCENSCPPNEVYSQNASQCQNTCFNRKFNETSNCHAGPGCVCEFGYTRHQDSYKCIKTSSCPVKENSKQCSANEVYSDCGAGCFKTCSSQHFNTTCTCKSGCVCKKGFIRSDINFQCIPESSCKRKECNLSRRFFAQKIQFQLVRKATDLLKGQNYAFLIAKLVAKMNFTMAVALVN